MSDYPEIVSRAAEAVLDKQGIEPVILDMRGLVGYTDYFIIATGESVLQVRAIADEIMRSLKEAGFKNFHVEGYESAGWVLLDYGDIIVHLFLSELRGFYDIEKLWADAPSTGIKEN